MMLQSVAQRRVCGNRHTIYGELAPRVHGFIEPETASQRAHPWARRVLRSSISFTLGRAKARTPTITDRTDIHGFMK